MDHDHGRAAVNMRMVAERAMITNVVVSGNGRVDDYRRCVARCFPVNNSLVPKMACVTILRGVMSSREAEGARENRSSQVAAPFWAAPRLVCAEWSSHAPLLAWKIQRLGNCLLREITRTMQKSQIKPGPSCLNQWSFHWQSDAQVVVISKPVSVDRNKSPATCKTLTRDVARIKQWKR